MKIIVCLKEVIDPAVSLDIGLRNSVVFREGLPLRLDPYDATALYIALNLKKQKKVSPVEITAVSIGSERVESYLRNGLAIGADKAIRIWDEGFSGLSSFQKARLLAGIVSLYRADIVLTGAASLDTGNEQVGPLMSARFGMPCLAHTIDIELESGQDAVIATRDIGKGEREKVWSPLPAVITVKGEGRLPYASMDNLIESKSSKIELLTPVDLGISTIELKNDPTTVTGLASPRPRPRKVPPLDSSLPAFYRILQLLEGGISKRSGRMLEGSSEQLVDQLFELLKDEGVIKPARGV